MDRDPDAGVNRSLGRTLQSQVGVGLHLMFAVTTGRAAKKLRLADGRGGALHVTSTVVINRNDPRVSGDQTPTGAGAGRA